MNLSASVFSISKMEMLKSTLEDTASHWVGTVLPYTYIQQALHKWWLTAQLQMIRKFLGICAFLFPQKDVSKYSTGVRHLGALLEAEKPYLTRPLCYLVNLATVVSTISRPEHQSLLRKLEKWVETDAFGYLPVEATAVDSDGPLCILWMPTAKEAHGLAWCLLNHVLKGTIFILFGIAYNTKITKARRPWLKKQLILPLFS